jgi:hypothetical protein
VRHCPNCGEVVNAGIHLGDCPYSRRIPRDQTRREFWQLVPGDQDAL